MSFGSTPEKQQAPEESQAQLALPSPKPQEPKPKECKDQDTKAEEPEQKEPKPLEPKPEEPKLEEVKPEGPKRRLTGKQAAASAPAKSLPKPGSLTILGHSGEERFRITYEARQLLTNLLGSAEEAVTGLVGKGLRVVPGQWARLSNISADGKWLRTERFKIGAVAQLDIMSQPAANVDSVILSWCIEKQATEHPCSLWQRDCFSSVFSESATKA